MPRLSRKLESGLTPAQLDSARNHALNDMVREGQLRMKEHKNYVVSFWQIDDTLYYSYYEDEA